MVPAKQRDAELLLERLDLAADRRLGDEQLARRLGEAQVAGRRLESLEQIERGEVAPIHSIFSCKPCRKIA
jgi:hypothetical protein